MANNIVITWTSDQRQLIADLQKQISLLNTSNEALKKLVLSGKTGGAQMQQATQQATGAYAHLNKAISGLKMSEFDLQKAAAKRLAAQKQAALDGEAAAKREADAKRSAIDAARKGVAKLLAEQKAADDREQARLIQVVRRQVAERKAAADREVQIVRDAENRKQALWRQSGQNRVGHLLQQMERERGVHDEAAAGIGRWAGRVAGLVLSYQALRSAIQFTMEANREAQRQAEEAMRAGEERTIRFRAQGGLTKPQGRVARRKIGVAAQVTATTLDEAFAMATAMESTGFDPEVAQGPALLELLKLKKAQALDPRRQQVSDTELGESFTKFLTATGQEKNAENVHKLAVGIQGLKETPVKITDIPFIARHASTLTASGMSPEEMLATFSHLLGTGENSEMAGTHLRLIADNLATIRNRPKEVKLLQRIGLRPDDVDLAGEDFFTALERIEGGIQKLPAGEQQAARVELFEERAANDFRVLAGSRAQVERLRSKMNDEAGFKADVQMTTTGKLADEVRNKNALEMQRAANDVNSANDRLRFEQTLNRQLPGNSVKNRVARAAGMKMYDTAEATLGHDKMVEWASANNPEFRRETEQRSFNAELDRREAERTISEGQAQFRRENPAAQPAAPPAPPPVNVQVNVQMPGVGEKPPPVPAAGLGR